MKKIKIPFNVKTLTKNPIQFSQNPEISVPETVGCETEASSDSQGGMSDQEDSINIFTLKTFKEKRIKKRKFKSFTGNSEISNLLLKKENKKEETLLKKTCFRNTENSEHSQGSDASENDENECRESLVSVSRVKCLHVDDISLRMEFIIHSKGDFDWLQEKSALKECIFVKKFLNSSQETLDILERFYTSLMYFVYPARSRAPSYVSELLKSHDKYQHGNSKRNLGSLEKVDSYLQEEIEEWKISFRSGYFMVRNRESRFLYYVNSEFSVLFSQTEIDSLKAYLSSSTIGLRKALEMDGIDFLEKKNSSSQKKTWPLEFNGVGQVHGLYEFLLKWTEPRSDKRSQSLPMLYSETAFLNASLKSSKIISSSKFQSADGDGYRMVIKGILFPDSIVKILDLLKEKYAEFTVMSPAWDVTKGLQEARGLDCFKNLEYADGFYYLI